MEALLYWIELDCTGVPHKETSECTISLVILADVKSTR